MARNNGVFADMEGDCVLYGDTTGELYRTRHEKSTTSDIFVVKLSQYDGKFSQTLEMTRGRFAAVGIGIFLFLSLLGCCFCAVGGRWCRRRRSHRKKVRDFEANEGVFRDDPSLKNGNHRSGGSYKDHVEENGNGHSNPGRSFEMSMVSSKPYQD